MSATSLESPGKRAQVYRGIYLVSRVLLFALGAASAQAQIRVASPDGRNEVAVEIHDGKLYYNLRRDGRALLLPSLLGFELQGALPLRDGLRLVDTTRNAVDETWTQPWGEVPRPRPSQRAPRVRSRSGSARPAVRRGVPGVQRRRQAYARQAVTDISAG